MFTSVQSWFERAISPFSATRYNALAHERLRFYTLLTIAFIKSMNFFGGTWDIQWHYSIGRDSLFIPPHLLVLAAFTGGLTVVLAAMAYETYLAQSGIKLRGVVQFGAIRAPAAFFGIYFGYTAAMLSAVFDEVWHRSFGIDATLWSPPHLCIMVSTMVVDLSLLVGLAASSRNLGWKMNLRSPFVWGIVLAGAYTLESVCFQMSEAFIVAFRLGGVGPTGLLFPILAGILFPFPLLLAIRLSRRYWVAGLIFALTIGLQYIGVGISLAGFAVLQPVSVIEEFVRDNPQSTIAVARAFMTAIGSDGLIGFMQAWIVWLSAVPLALVSLLGLWKWARTHLLVAAPVYSVSLVLVCYLWFHFTPTLRDYPTTFWDMMQGLLIAVIGGLVMGRLGIWLADKTTMRDAVR